MTLSFLGKCRRLLSCADSPTCQTARLTYSFSEQNTVTDWYYTQQPQGMLKKQPHNRLSPSSVILRFRQLLEKRLEAKARGKRNGKEVTGTGIDTSTILTDEELDSQIACIERLPLSNRLLTLGELKEVLGRTPSASDGYRQSLTQSLCLQVRET